jgi:hypothetical protein
MTKEQLINYIQISFVDDSKKRQLIDALNKGTTIADAQDIFEDLLIEKINEYGDQYEQASADFNSLTTELDKDIAYQEKALDETLDEKLATIDRNDYDARNKIWDDYYAETDKLNSSYEKKLKSIISGILVKT